MCSNRWVSYIYKSSNPIDRDSTFVREVIDSTETIVNCTAPDGLTEIFYASNSLCTVVENGGNATFSTEEADRLQTLGTRQIYQVTPRGLAASAVRAIAVRGDAPGCHTRGVQ